jgi:hypothetical protein
MACIIKITCNKVDPNCNSLLIRYEELPQERRKPEKQVHMITDLLLWNNETQQV